MSQQKFPDIVLALAAICQAIEAVQNLARKGTSDSFEIQPLFASTLRLEADNTEEIYGGYKNLDSGFRALIKQLSGSKTDADFGRYLISIITLEKQFSSDQKMIELMASRLAQTKRLFEYQNSDEVSSEIVERLAETYKDTISTLNSKIQVTGESSYLQQTANQNTIRALLLAAIRSAVLWRQVGGKKRQFIFNKQKIIDTAKAYLN